MRSYSASLGLSDKEFTLLRELIHERTGICYANGRSGQLADRLSERVLECGFNSFLDYYYLLKYDDKADAEWGQVIDLLAVPETYFWREMDQVHALARVLVPQHFANSQAPLRIWSAGCASGEEPLTIAMVLKESGWLDRAPIEIVGSDASGAAIARARAGVYRERSFRALPSDLRARYFRPTTAGDTVVPALHQAVEWRVVNLLSEPEVGPLATADVIFCRNVFIYFSDLTVRKVVGMFERYMPGAGSLFLGASESLLRFATRFVLKEVDGAFVYVKSQPE